MTFEERAQAVIELNKKGHTISAITCLLLVTSDYVRNVLENHKDTAEINEENKELQAV